MALDTLILQGPCSQNCEPSPFFIVQYNFQAALGPISQPVISGQVSPVRWRFLSDLLLLGDASLRGRGEASRLQFYLCGGNAWCSKSQAKGTKNAACLSWPGLPQTSQAAEPRPGPFASLALALYEGDSPASWSGQPSPGLNKKPQAIIHIKS